MGENRKNKRALGWVISGMFAAIAGVLYFASMARYAFPGDSARLIASWRGLDVGAVNARPLMSAFAKALGGGNLIAPIGGIVAVFLLYHLVSFFLRARVHGEQTYDKSGFVGRLGGVVATVVFMLTPAVRSAATHAEPRLFDFAWVLMSFVLFIPFIRIRGFVAMALPLLVGVLCGFGYLDSPVFLAMLPFYVAAIVASSRLRGGKPYLPLTLFAAAFLCAFLVGVNVFDLELTKLLKTSSAELKGYWKVQGWIFVAAFTTLPFVTAIFSSKKAYNEKPELAQWCYHIALTISSVFAIATPLAPSEVLGAYGILPVATSAFAAIVAGHLVTYWWLHRRTAVGIVMGGVLVFVLAVTCVWNLFSFDGERGAFADKVARKILADLGDRHWFVTDGVLDEHLLIAANDAGKKLNLVSLNRDLDEDYLMRLAEVVKAEGVGGSKNSELVLSLSLGVLPFVQDWFAADPSVASDVAIYGAPDLWYSVGVRPVPEFLFFGADAKREPDWSAWKEFDSVLEMPKGWGSYRHRKQTDPVERKRASIRRHLGLVANNRGVWLQDEKRDDEAFEMYERVLNEIDSDNVCALFNEIEMASARYPKALAKKRELEHKVKSVVADKSRRYYIWRLGNYYGYIRNPDMFVRLGYTWARSGRPGDALAQIRRAIDFVPSDKRTMLMNMMAAIYASADDRAKSRRIYESVLAKNSKDHDALIGMMRIELAEGNMAKAADFLSRAIEVADGNNERQLGFERAMLAMIRGEHDKASDLLKKLTDANPNDLRAWSLRVALAIQRIDAMKDPVEKKKALKDVETVLMPAMQKNSAGKDDYLLQTSKAFVLLRKEGDHRREARDAFAQAASMRPDVAAPQDLMMGLDISLNDSEAAEFHARDVLRRNRNAPLANYIMGSLALRKGDLKTSEAYLRKAADAAKPIPLALNDLAEVYRRQQKMAEAEVYARKATEVAPTLYVAWDTLASILIAENRNLAEAETCAQKACDLSRLANGKETDIRMYITLARVQAKKGDLMRAKATMRKVEKRLNELSEFEKGEFEELRKSVR